MSGIVNQVGARTGIVDGSFNYTPAATTKVTQYIPAVATYGHLTAALAGDIVLSEAEAPLNSVALIYLKSWCLSTATGKAMAYVYHKTNSANIIGLTLTAGLGHWENSYSMLSMPITSDADRTFIWQVVSHVAETGSNNHFKIVYAGYYNILSKN